MARRCHGRDERLGRRRALHRRLLTRQVDDMRVQSASVHKRYREIQVKLNEKPKNEVELQTLKDFVVASKEEVEHLVDEAAHVHTSLDALEEFQYRASEVDFQQAWSCKEWPR